MSAVVLDTNVFVAAGFNPASASANLVRAVRDGRLRMPWTDATRREIEHILGRIPPLRSLAVAELFHPADHVTAPIPYDWFDDIPDPDDRKFAALAHATGAVLVSNDEHLLRYPGPMDLTVMTPSAFWARWQRRLGMGEGDALPRS